MSIEVIAPNRIDLAGGTTDLYPVYLFMDGGFTVNAAISVQSKTVLKTINEPEIRIKSQDLDASTVLDLSLKGDSKGPLSLVIKALKAFPPTTGLEILTENQAPRGSGLGASSALLISLICALAKLRNEKWTHSQIIHYAADVETSLIGVPAGKQDHIAAFYGGISFIEFGYTGFSRKTCKNEHDVSRALEEMIILSYTGEGRFSGMNNWDVTRNVIESVGDVKSKLIQIRDVAIQLAKAIDKRDWDETANLMDAEWNLRKSLAPGVSTPAIDSIMRAASQSGALASKICGAGGGGCMITMVRPKHRVAVEKSISETGGSLIPFKIADQGANTTL